ncbi:hypothetical protein ACLKA6_014443 [Drosophila palustris]
MKIKEKLELQQLQKYFEKYGCVERLNLNPIENGRRIGYVVFANPCDAAKALRSICHSVCGCRIVVVPNYSWRQPDAEKMPHRPENVDPNEPPAAILNLNDHCLEHIFSQLSLPDRIHFARTCFRFRNIYEGMSPFLDKSINFNSNLFEAMTAWDLRDFFQLSGRNIKKIEGTIQRRYYAHVCSFLGMHCINLHSMRIEKDSFVNPRLFANLNSLQNLELDGFVMGDEHLQALMHLKQLKKLDLSSNDLTGLLPSLKKLKLDFEFLHGLAISPKLFTWLVEHKSEQLEHFEITHANADYFGDEILLKIGKLIALQTLTLHDCYGITDRGLGELFTLQNLREINIESNTKITDNGVLRLILDCPKLQVLHLEDCEQLTDKLLRDIILKLQNNQYNRPLPIKLNMMGTKVSQFTLMSADVAAKNIIDVTKVKKERNYSFEYRDYGYYDDNDDYGDYEDYDDYDDYEFNPNYDYFNPNYDFPYKY